MKIIRVIYYRAERDGHIKDDAVIVTRVDEVCNNCQEVYGAIENDCGLCEEWI